MWTSDCQTALDELKDHVTSAPVLSFPNFENNFILDTDASNTGIWGVLSQLQDDGMERVIA